MARSKEQIMADLDIRQINYDEEMSYVKLRELLKEAEDKEKEAEAKAKAKEQVEVTRIEGTGTAEEPATKKPGKKAKKPMNTDVAGVTCGLKATQNQEMRIRVIEYKLEHKLGIKP